MEPQAPDAPQADSLLSLLDQLQGYAEPAPVSMWPATWAWAAAAALALAALAAAAFAWARRRRADAWRRAALAELAALAPALEAGEPAALGRLQILLRRVALATDARGEVADLTGAAWAGYLARTGGGFGPLAAALADAPYRPAAVLGAAPGGAPAEAFDGPAALAAARAWIRSRHA